MRETFLCGKVKELLNIYPTYATQPLQRSLVAVPALANQLRLVTNPALIARRRAELQKISSRSTNSSQLVLPKLFNEMQ